MAMLVYQMVPVHLSGNLSWWKIPDIYNNFRSTVQLKKSFFSTDILAYQRLQSQF